MDSKATTVEQYLASLPEDRRELVLAVRDTIRANLGAGYAEGMQYGMIGWCVPHSVYPAGYHCDPAQPLPFAGLASQKGHVSLYLFGIYADPELADWFRDAWLATGKKLDMGKSCVRFKRLADVPLELVGEAIRRLPLADFVARYEAAIGPRSGGGGARSKAASRGAAGAREPAPRTKKQPAKKQPAKKQPAKKAPRAGKPAKKASAKKAAGRAPATKQAVRRPRTKD